MSTLPTLVVRSYGGTSQLAIRDDQDLARIDTVDPARWAATSAPTRDLHCDKQFLDYVDVHSKSRLRVSEIVGARDWAFQRLADRRALIKRSDVLRLDDVDVSREPGQRIRRAAERVLAHLGAQERQTVSLAQVRSFKAGYGKALVNGDGIVPPELAPEPDLAAFLRDVIAVVGSVPDRSGHAGVGGPQLERFLAGGRQWLAWRARRTNDAAVLPWGDATDAAATLVRELDPPIEELFWQGELLRHHGAAGARPSDAELTDLQKKGRAAVVGHLAAAPIALPDAHVRLDLDGPTNPVFREKLEALRRDVLSRALGPDVKVLDRAAWAKVEAVFAAHEAWRAARPPEPFEKLGEARLAALLDGPLPGRAQALIQQDRAAAEDVAQVDEVERLVLYQRWLIDLANNFVNFSAIYHPTVPALVETGSLILDGRRLDFCVRVVDRAAHKAIAADSMIFLVYAAIAERDMAGATAFEVVAPVTAGERGRLRVGKRGIFVDLEGREWDATVVDLVVHPISLAEAVKAPFRRAAAFVNKKVEDLIGSKLSAAETSAQGSLGDAVDKPTAATAPAPAPPPPPPAPAPAPAPPPAPAGGGIQSTLLVGSVAFAALGSAFTFLLKTVAEISPGNLFAALGGVVGTIVGLSALLGFIKLRRRDLSMILEASGWAVNAPLKVTRSIGGVFTRTPAFPKGARREVFVPPLEVEDDEVLRVRHQRKVRIILGVILALVGAFGVWYVRSPSLRKRVSGWIDHARQLFVGKE